jgi:hypothetical protein
MQEESSGATAWFGMYERLVTRMFLAFLTVGFSELTHHKARYKVLVFCIFERGLCVEQILRIHQRVLIALRERCLRIERSENRPYSLSPGDLGTLWSLTGDV